MRQNSLSILPFSQNLLRTELGDHYCVEYIIEYLQALNSTSVVREGHYIDRHYLDDFVGYYAKSFHPPHPYTSRWHFFKTKSRDEIDYILSTAYENPKKLRSAQKALEELYLGFVVERPLKGAPIGRTVLKTYSISGRRHYEVVRPYKVHLAGIELGVHGLAYQQQDQGAAVCASTALWVALQRVAYVAGKRTPTPSMITAAANSPFPACYGLSDLQMAAALSALGYTADLMIPEDNRPLFRAKLVACLDSQLPVILLLSQKQKTHTGTTMAGHAVTVTGYSEPPSVLEIPPRTAGMKSIGMKGASVQTLYVHDDNLGSHAHYELFDSAEKDCIGNPQQALRRGRSSGMPSKYWRPDEWMIDGALIPKPDKMRLPIERLFSLLTWLRGIFEQVLPGMEIHYQVFLSSGIGYRRELFEKDLDPGKRRTFHETLSLPRHIGVIRAYKEENPIFDTLIDATEISSEPHVPPVLAFVADGLPKNSVGATNLSALARSLQVEIITAQAH
jgi:hypothetical protein